MRGEITHFQFAKPILQVDDLEAEQAGLREALKSALLMMSERHDVIPTPRNQALNAAAVEDGTWIADRIENASVRQASEKMIPCVL